MDLATISDGLRPGQEGIWTPRGDEREAALSFPTDGHAECYQIEESSFWFRHRNACLRETLRRFPPPGALFELGAGNGFVSSALEKAGYTCVALEPGREGARNARRRGVGTVVCATLEAAAFRADSLPAIGLFDVIEHIEQPRPFLAEAVRALAPGGRLYVTVPAFRWLWSDEDVVAGHFRRYTLRRLRKELAAVGLKVEYASYLFAALVLPVFLLRTMVHVGTRLSRLLRRGRSAETTSHAVAQHVPRPGLVTRTVIRALRLEGAWLRAGRHVPIGTSCLIVARK